jgi:hypothetical protein
MRKVPVLAGLLLFHAVFSPFLHALTIHAFEGQFELRRIGVEASDLKGSTAAVWTNAVALRTPIALGDGAFFLVPSLSLTSLYYYYNTDTEQPTLTDVEWRELTALVPRLDTAFRWVFFQSDKARYSIEAGPGLSFPVPVKTYAASGNSGEIIPAIYSGGQFFLVMAALQASLPVFQGPPLLVRLSTYLPTYRLWDGSGLPITDGLELGFSIGLGL